MALACARAQAPPAAGPSHAVINRDNVLVIDGRKVFPIGFTMPPPPGGKTPDGRDALAELADAGANFLRTGPQGGPWDDGAFAREQAWEDAAARHGMHCLPYLREAGAWAAGDATHAALLRRIVERFRNHPGLGAWKGADEPEWGKRPVADCVRAYDLLRRLDPNHPLCLIEAPRGTVETLRPYNAGCDIVGADIYPIGYPPGTHSLLPNKDISMVGDYTDRMMEVAGGRKPVWMVLQIAWSGVAKPGKTLRFPTFPEERFMTYEAIIRGARGLLFFGGSLLQTMTPEDRALGWNWRFWRRVLRPVVEEIGEHSPLYPALVAPDSPLPVRVTQGSGVELCVRETGGALYLLACKRSGPTEQVTFDGLPSGLAAGDVLFEPPRTVRASAGRLTDWFAPHEVHVYRFRE